MGRLGERVLVEPTGSGHADGGGSASLPASFLGSLGERWWDPRGWQPEIRFINSPVVWFTSWEWLKTCYKPINNGINSPVEVGSQVGSWNPIIYQGFIHHPSLVGVCWGFLAAINKYHLDAERGWSLRFRDFLGYQWLFNGYSWWDIDPYHLFVIFLDISFLQQGGVYGNGYFFPHS